MTKFDGNIIVWAVIKDSQLFLAIWDQPRLSSSFHWKNTGVTMAVIVRYDDISDNITYVTYEKWPYQKLYDTIGSKYFSWMYDSQSICGSVHRSVYPSAHLSIHPPISIGLEMAKYWKKCKKSMGNIITYQNHIK